MTNNPKDHQKNVLGAIHYTPVLNYTTQKPLPEKVPILLDERLKGGWFEHLQVLGARYPPDALVPFDRTCSDIEGSVHFFVELPVKLLPHIRASTVG
jgi:hypothetical protein